MASENDDMGEEIQAIANAWLDYATTHRLNPNSQKTYKRAQADFLAGALAAYAALNTDPPPRLVIAWASGRDFSGAMPSIDADD